MSLLGLGPKKPKHDKVKKKKTFKYWPPPKEGEEYGPSEKQRLLWFETMPDEVKDKIAHHHSMDIVLFLGGTRCFGYGTEVRMYDGRSKRVEDIEKDDVLLGPDGSPRKVVDRTSGYGPLYEVRTEDGRSYFCNSKHKLGAVFDDMSNTGLTVEEYLEVRDWLLSGDGSEPYLVDGPSGCLLKFSVTPAGYGGYCGFTLAGKNHAFLLANGVVSENSGKTIAAVARCLQIARRYPGAKIVVGSLNFSHLEETVMKDYERLLTKHSPFDHPSIRYPPGRHRKRIEFRNSSVIRFMNLENFLRALGQEADIAHIEEPELLKSSDALEVLITRMSSPVVPFKQIILTANPTEDLTWMIEWFHLEQFEEDYKGPVIPIGQPCTCHLCPRCLNKKKNSKEVGWVQGECPECGKKKQKNNTCPGRQYFQRVVISDASDNKHLDDNYQSNLNATLSYDKRMRFSKGFVLNRKKGRIYTCFEPQNVLSVPRPYDPTKPLIWSLDFNNRPQCSVVLQEYKEEGVTKVYVIDEIVMFDAGPEQVANEFLKRYAQFDIQELRIYGDPAGLTGGIKDVKLDSLHTILQIVDKKLTPRGTKVVLKARATVFGITSRLNAVNWMLKDGNAFRRMYFNPGVHNLIKSAEKTEWDIAGKKEREDDDKKARAKGKNGEVWPMTHPMAALGYFIVEEHPMIPHAKEAPPYIHNPETGIVSVVENGKLVEYRVGDEVDQELREIEMELEEEWKDEEYERDYEEGPSTSIASYLRGRGSWFNDK